MSDKIDEQLSALADDELPRREWPLVWRRLRDEPELAGRWARYHLIGDALRDALPRTLDPGLAAAVSAAVAREPAPARMGRPWARLAGGAAIAASVAALALLTLQVDPIGDPPPSAVVVPVTANPQLPPFGRLTTASGARWEQAEPEVEAELNRYLLDHADLAEPIEGDTP